VGLRKRSAALGAVAGVAAAALAITGCGSSNSGSTGATSGGANEDFGLGKLDMYIDGPWAQATLPKNSVDTKNISSFPIPSENGPNPAPVFSGGSDLAVFKTSPNKQAAWDLISVMDNPANSTSFAKLSGFFPPYSAAIAGGVYPGDAFMQGFGRSFARRPRRRRSHPALSWNHGTSLVAVRAGARAGRGHLLRRERSR
jgi:ABC-type glycerol-3-phosphate transport system substrate-binding protein